MSGLKTQPPLHEGKAAKGLDIAKDSRTPLLRKGHILHLGLDMAIWSCKQEKTGFSL